MASFLNHKGGSDIGTDVSSKEKVRVGMVLKDHLKINAVNDAEELAMNVILSDQSMVPKMWHTSAIGSKLLYLCTNQDTTNLAWDPSRKQLPHPLYFLFHPQENQPDARDNTTDMKTYILTVLKVCPQFTQLKKKGI